jgi:hypothetical protein
LYKLASEIPSEAREPYYLDSLKGSVTELRFPFLISVPVVAASGIIDVRLPLCRRIVIPATLLVQGGSEA